MRNLTTSRKRSPEASRRFLIAVAYREIYINGYAGASLSQLQEAAGVSRGAIYHHFSSKKDLMLAVINEVIQKNFSRRWTRELRGDNGILDRILQSILSIRLDFRLGCPLGKLVSECPFEEGEVREGLLRIYSTWEGLFVDALARAKKTQQIRADVDVASTAAFVVALTEGALNRAKLTGKSIDFRIAVEPLATYLDAIRAQGSS